MNPDLTPPPSHRKIAFELQAPGLTLEAETTVPIGPSRTDQLLPLARGLADQVVQAATRAVEAGGRKISCRAGCGACCRTLVAISEPEARHLRDLIAAMPEPRRSEIRARFAAASQRLEAAGLLDELRAPEKWDETSYASLAARYFRLGLPCPFLEDESCSIHAERPVTCREYLVFSPPEHCAHPDSEGVRRVRLPLRVFNALARAGAPEDGTLRERVVALVLAPEWADQRADPAPARSGTEVFHEFLRLLSMNDGDDSSRGAESGKRFPND